MIISNLGMVNSSETKLIFATVSWEDLVKETVLFGSPERIVDGVREMQEAGVGELLCWMNFGGFSPDLVKRSMRLFAEKVMPRFR